MDPRNRFCDNPNCPSRGKTGEGNIVGHGASHGHARYRCKTCGQTFTETKGTPFFRQQKPDWLLVACWTLLAFGCPPQAIVAAFGIDERTVYRWLLLVGQHCKQVHERLVLQQPRQLHHVQADEIRVRLQGRVVAWMAMALQVPCRLWLGGVVRQVRDQGLIHALAQRVKACALFGPLLLVTDGLASYVTAWRKAFRSPLLSGQVGRPALVAWPVLIGQVLKRKVAGRLVGVSERLIAGTLEEAETLIGSGHLHTAYMERLNATFRARLSALVRRGRALVKRTATLEAGMYLVGTVYNFCTPHKSLRWRCQRAPDGAGWVVCKRVTPAMAAGLTDHLWSVAELMHLRVPPPPFLKPLPRGRRPKSEPKPLCYGRTNINT